MKLTIQTLALFLIILFHSARAEEHYTSAKMEKDPKTIAEFSQIVQDTTRKGSMRVCFPSGEWNWYSNFQRELPKKERFAEWTLQAAPVKKDELSKWLTENKIAAVQISMGKDCSPTVFFEIEAVLRLHKVVYWVRREQDSAKNKTMIRLLETDGITD